MMTKIFGLALLIAAVSGPARAADDSFLSFGNDHHDHHGNGGPAMAAPEIDPASAMSALTMLASGLVIVRGRRSKK
jgi:hypothetical protein